MALTRWTRIERRVGRTLSRRKFLVRLHLFPVGIFSGREYLSSLCDGRGRNKNGVFIWFAGDRPKLAVLLFTVGGIRRGGMSETLSHITTYTPSNGLPRVHKCKCQRSRSSAPPPQAEP